MFESRHSDTKDRNIAVFSLCLSKMGIVCCKNDRLPIEYYAYNYALMKGRTDLGTGKDGTE